MISGHGRPRRHVIRAVPIGSESYPPRRLTDPFRRCPAYLTQAGSHRRRPILICIFIVFILLLLTDTVPSGIMTPLLVRAGKEEAFDDAIWSYGHVHARGSFLALIALRGLIPLGRLERRRE